MSDNTTETKTEAAPMIYEKIVDVMRAVGAIGKNKQNTHQKYSFRGIDDMYNALHEPMATAGIFAAPRVLSRDREERKGSGGGNLIYTILEVEHRFYATDGSSVSVVTIGEAMDSGDKSCNKAQSAAYKYALMELFCIPTEEKLDTEYETHTVAPKNAPQAPPRARQTPNGQSHARSNGSAPQAAPAPRNAPPQTAPRLTPMQELMKLCEGAQLCIDEQGRAIVPQIVNVLKKEGFSTNISAENYSAAFAAIQRHYEAPAPTEPQRGAPMPVAALAAEYDANDDSDPFGDDE